jgi:hypothetical protein
MVEEINGTKKPDFFDLLESSHVAIQAILRGLQSISSKVNDGADVKIVIDDSDNNASISVITRKSELHVYYKKENEETAKIVAVYKKRLSDKEVMLKRGEIELLRHLSGQIFEATKEIVESLEFGNVTLNRIAEIFADIMNRINQYNSSS